MNRSENPKSMFDEGVNAFNKGDFFNAIDNWEKVSTEITDNAGLFSLLSNAYKEIKQFEKSYFYLEKALDLEPDRIEYIHRYAMLLVDSKKFNKAHSFLKQMISIKPKEVTILNNLGVVCFYLDRYQEAVSYFEQVLEIDKSYLDAMLNMIKTLFKSGKKDIALNKVEKFRVVKPDSIELKNWIKILKSDFQPDIINKDSVELEFSGKRYLIDPVRIHETGDVDKISSQVELSIVIPIKNEEENIPILFDNLTRVLKNLKQEYEIIFIDDGSTDGSLEALKKISKTNKTLRVIEFRKNYGQTAAMSAGFKYSRGSVIITMDGDLQNDPQDIPRLLEKMSEGYDLVSGWRKNRQDKALTRVVPSKIANALINKLIAGTGIKLHDYGCTLKAYKRGIVKNIKLYGEMHRFIPAFAAWLGVKVAEIPVNHHPRKYGYAKYNLSRVSRVIFDLIVVRFFGDYLTRPIQFFGKIAKNLTIYGLSIMLILTVVKLIWSDFFLDYNTIIILVSILLFSSLQLLIMGLLGEIMMRVYFEGQKKEYYIVENIIQKK